MAALSDLPTEILVHILRYANLNGDLAGLRQCNHRFLEVISRQGSFLLSDLCFQYRIASRAVDIFLSARKSEDHGSSGASSPSTLNTIALSSFLHKMNIVAADMDRASSNACVVVVPQAPLDKEQFMLLAALSRSLQSLLTVPSTKDGDLLAPSIDATRSVSISLSEELVHWLGNVLTLSELEGVIAAINICATRLWSTIFLFQSRECAVASFGGLSGVSFNTNQAVLMEHVIWKGPVWVSHLLERYSSTRIGKDRDEARVDTQIDDSIVKEGVWKGSQEEGARLAANGMARLLWRTRLEKFEKRRSSIRG